VDGKTVASIEVGEPGQVEKIDLHAQAFGLSIVHVLSTALDQTKKPLSPEASQLLELFENMAIPGRQALLITAQALPKLAPVPPAPLEAPPAAHQSPGARPEAVPRKS
jgi:hypothetical protein